MKHITSYEYHCSAVSNFIEQIPCWRAASSSAGEVIILLLSNTNFQNSLSPELSPEPAEFPPSKPQLFKIHFGTIVTST